MRNTSYLLNKIEDVKELYCFPYACFTEQNDKYIVEEIIKIIVKLKIRNYGKNLIECSIVMNE